MARQRRRRTSRGVNSSLHLAARRRGHSWCARNEASTFAGSHCHDPGEGIISARGCFTKSSVALPWEPKQEKLLPRTTSALRCTFCRQILGDLHAQILLQRSDEHQQGRAVSGRVRFAL